MFEAGCSLFHAQCRSTCSLFHTQCRSTSNSCALTAVPRHGAHAASQHAPQPEPRRRLRPPPMYMRAQHSESVISWRSAASPDPPWFPPRCPCTAWEVGAMAGEGSCLRLPDSELSRIMRSNLHKHVRENSWVKSEESGIGKLRVLGRRSSPWGGLGVGSGGASFKNDPLDGIGRTCRPQNRPQLGG